MHDLTRRRFLALSGVTAGAALAASVSTPLAWADVLDGAVARPLPAGRGVLVVVTLYGGNDGLNTVVPAADHAYQDARPDLAYGPGEVLPLGEGLGLNPGMAGLKALWDQQRLAVVRGVGYPRPDRSHFRSMAIWQTASPTSPSGAGWLGRWLDGGGDDPLRAVSMDAVLPPFLAGEHATAVTLPSRGVSLPTGQVGDALRALAGSDPDDDAARARVARSVADLQQVVTTLGPAVDGVAPLTGDAAGNTLAQQLRTVAALVEARVPTRVYAVSLGGFDTHGDERGTQQRLLGQLDQALAPFVTRMAGSEAGRQVVTVVYSEFGRRVRANASHGTDHGTANPVLVLGSRVRGGFHGAQPSLTDLDDGDLKATTDFRDIYATALEDVLGTDAGPVLRGWRGRVEALVGAGS